MDSPSLHDRRLAFVTGLLLDAKAGRVLDLGCGAGRLLARLVQEPGFTRITGLDASASSLAVARGELAAHLASGRLVLLHGQVYAPHPGAGNADAVTLVEVIEHLDPQRLSAAERCVFGHYRPPLVVVTTPNVEYNPLLGLREGQRRDPEHRFEWSRERFRSWATGVAKRNGYRVQTGGIGPNDADAGAPTQYAVFRRSPASA
ncbi:MAG TPA: methyltransferase domain-containing protein [Arenimonas sp.]